MLSTGQIPVDSKYPNRNCHGNLHNQGTSNGGTKIRPYERNSANNRNKCPALRREKDLQTVIIRHKITKEIVDLEVSLFCYLF